MWVTEVEFTHHARLTQILQNRKVECTVKIGNLKGDATLLLTEVNLTEPGVLPIECYKYIFKAFHAPYCCRDPSWFTHHPAMRALINSNAKFRIQSIPKAMGPHLAEALIGEDDIGGIKPENISFTNNTHIFQCFYSIEYACFYWGVSLVADPCTQSASWVSLRQAVLDSSAAHGIAPICRAYYKMQEIVEHFFPLWLWESPPAPFQAVDIGASPGGWTQYVALCMGGDRVLAVDPGDVDADLLARTSGRGAVTHCRALAEAPETRDALAAFGGFKLCVCDINVDPWGAIKLLIDYVLPYAGILSTVPIPIGTESSDGSGATACSDNSFGYLILTLKLLKNPKEKHINKAVKTVIDALSSSVPASPQAGGSGWGVRGWDFKVVHLNANSRNERTVVCKFCNIPSNTSSSSS
jgi:hypothetical protein